MYQQPPYQPPPPYYYPPQPPPPPPPVRKYSQNMFVILASVYAISLLLCFIGVGSSHNTSSPTPIFRLGIALFIGIHVCLLIMDAKGFFTLQTGKRAGCLGFAVIYFLLMPFVMGLYLIRTHVLYKKVPAHIPLVPSRKPKIGLILGGIVAIFVLISSTSAGAVATNDSSTLATISAPTATVST